MTLRTVERTLCLLVLAVGLGSCAEDGALLVVAVDATGPVKVDELEMTVTAGGRARRYSIAVVARSIPPALRIGVELPAEIVGVVDVKVRAGALQVSGKTKIVAGERVDLPLLLEPDAQVDMAMPTGPADLSPTCGDSSIGPGEECDDGNLRGGDGCSALCMKE